MISMLFPRSPLCTLAIVFYTYVCIPLGKLKKMYGDDEVQHCDDDDGYNLTGVRFGDKEKMEEEMCCPICLVDFEDEDVVTHLPRCDHLFHIYCIEPWLHRGNLTCPLCRSFVLSPTSTNHNVKIASSSCSPALYLSLFSFLGLVLHILGYL